MRRRLSSWKITPLGWLLVLVVPVALVLALFGPGSVRIPALVVAVVVLYFVVGDVFEIDSVSIGRRGRVGKRADYVSAPVEADETAWRREREKREKDAAGESGSPPSPFG
jgi:hypothetical protein